MKLVLSPPRRTSALLLLAAGLVAGASLLTRGAAPLTLAPSPSSALSARAASSHLLRGASETHIAVTVRAPELADDDARPPVAMAVVIDRSGSMSGAPLDHAKAAAQGVIARLAPTDRFAVVTYSTGAETIVEERLATPDALAHAARAIAAIDADGGTNLSEGLALGARAIAGAGGLRRIVLISDGQANEGLVDRGDLAGLAAVTAAAGASITSVGVGLDFDERTMTAIAIAGRGHYYFVEDTRQLDDMFVRELASLGDTAVSDATLSVVPTRGVTLLDAYGHRVAKGRAGWTIPIADLRSGEVRKVVLRVGVAAGEEGERALASLRLTWRPRGQSDIVDAGAATVRVRVTGDVREVMAHRDREVVRQVEDVETARALDRAADAYERGDRREAAGILEEREQAAAAVSADLADPALEQKVRRATGKVKGAFAAPPSDADGSKRAIKASREDAYRLTY